MVDLEGVTDGDSFETLRNKGKWEQSLHKAVPAARPFVDPESKRTVSLDASLGWNEESFKGFIKELVGSISGLSRIVGVYRDHAPTVAALSKQIEATDRLIDQIVYKLYGLTEDEIRLVEESTK